MPPQIDVPKRFEVEAMQLRLDGSNAKAILAWISANGGRATRTGRGDLIVTTSQRPRYALARLHFGWWVARLGTEFVVCGPGTFEPEGPVAVEVAEQTAKRMTGVTKGADLMPDWSRLAPSRLIPFDLRTGMVVSDDAESDGRGVRS